LQLSIAALCTSSTSSILTQNSKNQTLIVKTPQNPNTKSITYLKQSSQHKMAPTQMRCWQFYFFCNIKKLLKTQATWSLKHHRRIKDFPD
jgi:hypothetical protein